MLDALIAVLLGLEARTASVSEAAVIALEHQRITVAKRLLRESSV